MRCEEIESRMSRYLDGVLAVPEREAVEAHLRECPFCTALEGNLRNLVAALKAPAVEPPSRVWGRLAASIEERRRHPGRQAVRRVAPKLLAAAAGLLLALGSLIPVLPRRPAQESIVLGDEDRYLSGLLTSAASTRVSQPRDLKLDAPVEGLLAAVLSQGRKP